LQPWRPSPTGSEPRVASRGLLVMGGSRPRLLVLTSTYPRGDGDPEPGFVHELARRLVGRFQVTVVCPHAVGAATREDMDGVHVVRYRYAPERWETLVNDGGIVRSEEHTSELQSRENLVCR